MTPLSSKSVLLRQWGGRQVVGGSSDRAAAVRALERRFINWSALLGSG